MHGGKKRKMHSVINLAGRGAARLFSCGLVVIGFISCSGRRPGAAAFSSIGLRGRQYKKNIYKKKRKIGICNQMTGVHKLVMISGLCVVRPLSDIVGRS